MTWDAGAGNDGNHTPLRKKGKGMQSLILLGVVSRASIRFRLGG